MAALIPIAFLGKGLHRAGYVSMINMTVEVS